ncbi:ras-related protein Rab-36 [Guaruba guarouba]
MKSNKIHLVSPVSRDRVLSWFPKDFCKVGITQFIPTAVLSYFQWYTPEASLQFEEHFHAEVRTACQQGAGLDRQETTCMLGKPALSTDYKATNGVDFEMECFEIIGISSAVQIWDTAGQEKFKCIGSVYCRGAVGCKPQLGSMIHIVVTSSEPISLQWLADALRENEPDSSFIFLAGTKPKKNRFAGK